MQSTLIVDENTPATLSKELLEDLQSKDAEVITDEPSPMDVKSIIAEMVAKGEMSEAEAANMLRMFGGVRPGQRLGKHNIARGLRAKARIAKHKKKR